MTMTRQHFALIAEVVKDHHTRFEGERNRILTESMAKQFACALSSTNPNFNRARFLRACGVED